MIVQSIEEYVVYESPDGGKTIYSRKSGSSERTLIQEDPEKKITKQWLVWRDIIKLAETEPSLRDLLDKAEIVYALLKEEKNN